MVIVYHNKDFLELQFKEVNEIPRENLTKVAEVAINDLETALGFTNDWTEKNERVTPLISNPRSTSVGDVMEIDNKFYEVAPSGFTEIKII